MKKATNKLMSFLAAFAMVLSVLVAPFANANAAADNTQKNPTEATEKTTKTLTIHKILMSKDGLEKHDAKKEYDGKQIDNIGSFFEEGAKEIDGVYFKLQEPAEGVNNPDVNNNDHWEDLGEGYQGLTTKDGLKINDVSKLKGKYRIVEVHEKSTYVGEKGATLTDKKAVPSIIVLPLINNDGVVTDAHMYPKNTENAPKIDKNFLKDNGLEAAEGYEAADLLKVGADYKNYQAKKATAEAEVGKNIPYEVKTEIPAKSNLAEAKWDDKMTAGLTYNKDLKVTIDGKEINPSEEELTQTDNGFVLRLKGANLALLNGKDKAVTVELKYSATVNSSAIADIPEANDIKFFYGNTPSKGTTPLPTKPNENGEVTVKKTWDNGSKFVDGEWAKFKLVDANTGEDVTVADLVEPKEETKKADFNTYKEGFQGTVTLSKGTEESHTWKYLNKDKQYKVVEVESKTLSDAEYTKAENGTVEVTNHKSNNPKPLNPTEPKVVLGGKKFVKTNNKENDELKRLAGAEFYVKNAEGKYLVAAKKDAKAVTDAKKALDEAVKAYNALDADKQTEEEKAKVTTAQEAYNKAFKENATAYTWEADTKNAVVLTSDGEGKFEISGLEYGSYKLEEKTAPKGYAKLSGDVKFDVKKGSYSAGDIDYKPESNAKDALKVINKKVTIPETGGIGSLIFIVAGLALMGVAFVAMKRRNSYEEA